MSHELSHPHVYAVVGILKRDDTFLVAERPIGKPYSGYWEFPGGKIEPNELGEQALKRELYEELGVQITSAQFCFEHVYPYPDKIVVLEIWWVNAFSGEPQGREHQTLRWVTWSEMLALRLLEGNWPIVERMKTLMME